MKFRLLGPLEVSVGGRRVDLGGLRQRRVLAALLLGAGRVVPLSRLVEAAWDDDPPATAQRQARNRVAALRQILGRIGNFIDTEADGYRLRVAPGELDLAIFGELARRGQATGDAGLLRQALGVWRGPVLSGLGGACLAREVAPIEEQRLAVWEERLDLELAAGAQEAVVAELGGLVGAHPVRERLVGLWMTALHRCGRTREALSAYSDLAARLADELGIDPSPELRRLREELAQGGPSGPALVAAQLPHDVPDFTGRVGDLARLDGLLSDAQIGRTVVISAIAGTAGVGKTALAVHWGHRVRDKFPDGQLYVNLRGYAAGMPMTPLAALAQLLRSLGVPAERVPTELDAAAAAYRSILAGRRVLVMLDNAAEPDQVRPLLPGDPGCLVVVTSRDRLSGLVAQDRAHRLVLDVLTPAEAYTLLRPIVGQSRVDAEPGAASELGRLCARLPLALRIAAANLADQPTRSIAGYIAELARSDRLAALEVDGDPHAAVRAAFELSLATLPPAAQRMFRLLGLVPGPEITVAAAAALAGCPAEDTRHLLDRLAAAHLIDRPAPGRFAFHDLLRLYAAQRGADQDTEPDRAAATGRLFAWYLHGADAAARHLYPELQRLPLPAEMGATPTTVVFDGPGQANAWLNAERANLVVAAAHGPRPVAWLLADATRGYFAAQGHHVDWLTMGEAARTAAVNDADLRGHAAAQITLGLAHRRMARPDAAIAHYTQACDLARQAGWRQGEAAALGSLASAHAEQGRHTPAADLYHQASDIYRRTGGRGGEAISHENLGVLYRRIGHLEKAAEHSRRALALYEEIGSDSGRAYALNNLANVCQVQGHLDDALEHLDRSLRAHRLVGSRDGEVDTLSTMAEVHRTAGRYAEAIEHAETALALARQVDLRRAQADILDTLGTTHERLGDHQQAIEHHRNAHKLAQEVGYLNGEAKALAGTAAALLGMGALDEAAATAEQAIALAEPAGFPIPKELATATLAAIAAAQHAHGA
jgi:DNA-binding SARP family transcriptional activator/tetratricopeptide (TPR) repeat protein